MKRFYYLFFVLSMLITTSTFAQVSGYSFSSSSGTYTEISGGTLLGSGTIDDDSYNANSIGFTFNYNGTDYTQFSVNANGFLALGASVTSSYTALSTGLSNNVIAAFNGDLQGNTGGSLRYELSGTSPNQVLTIQWKDFRHYGATSESYNFQIKLYETTNNIAFVYGTIIKNIIDRTRQVGLRGSSNSDFNNRTTTTDWAASTAGSTNSASMALTQTVYPASGLTYTWAPPTSPVFNITPASKNFGYQLTGTSSAYQQFIISNVGAGTLTITTGNISITGTDASQFELADSNSYPINLTTGQTANVYVRFSPTSVGSKSANLQIVDNTKATQNAPLSGIAFDPATAPWSEGFESVTIPEFPTGWFKENGDWVTTNNASSTYDADARTGTQFLREAYFATNEYIWTLPFQLTGGVSYDFSFWWAGDNYAGWTGDVFYNTSQISTGATQLGTSFVTSGVTTTKTYVKVINTFIPPATGLYYFAIRVNASYVPWYLSFDDFGLELTPACLAPTALTATNITTTSADLGWTENGSATKWDIELGPFGFTPTGTPTQAGVTSNPYTYTGLSPATQYSFYVRADCGAKEDTSPWAGPYSFTTECGTLSLPYSQSFDDDTFPPLCWSTYNNGSGNNWLRTTTHTYAGAGAMYYPYHASNAADAWAFTPGFNLTSGVKYRVTFWQKVRSTSYPENLKVTVGSDRTVGSQTTTLLDLPNLTNTTYMQHTIDFVCPSTGTYYFAFNCYSDVDMWNLYVDEVSIDIAPEFIDAEVTAILSPASMETLGATVTPQVTVKNNSENTKNVPVITEIWQLPPQSKSIEISAKSSETIFTNVPYSRADMIETNEKTKKELSFKFTIPENPNKFIETGELLTENFNNVSTFPPTGWTRIQNNTNQTANQSCYWDTLTRSFNSPSACAGIWWDYSYQDEWLISPPVTLAGSPTGKYNLKWYYYGFKGSSYGDHYYTKISTDNGSTWTVLYDLTAQPVGWNYWVDPVEIDITAYAGQTIKVAFHAEDPATNDGLWYVWFVDDVQIGYGPAMVYRDSVMVSSLGSGSSSNPVFANWIANPTGNYFCKAYTVLASDAVAGNDLMTKNFQVVTTLNITALIEGRYDGTSMVSDTVTVAIRNSSSPYAELGSAYVVLNASGAGTAFINAGANSVNYYIVVKHRNALETWSGSTPQFSSGVMSYNFTTAPTQAYGDNMKLKGTKWCIFSGDIQPKDGLIDLTDVINIVNDANAFLFGTALLTDLTGDDSVDLTDIIIAVNNANAFVSVITP